MKKYDVSLNYVLREDGPAISLSKPELVHEYMRDAFAQNPEQESFWVIFLNRKNYPKGRQMVTLGTATSSLAHPREVFRAAILAGATGIICAHNHPGGDPAPSSADVMVTRILRDAGKIIDIDILDHVICGDISCDPTGKGYYSFRDHGMI